jgi:hypothetical protein
MTLHRSVTLKYAISQIMAKGGSVIKLVEPLREEKAGQTPVAE